MAIKKINTILVSPKELPKVIEISNNLKELQELIGNKFQTYYLPNDNNVCIIYSNDDMFKEDLLNRCIGTKMIFGKFIIIGNDEKNGDFKSLTNKQIEKYITMFGEESITKARSRLIAHKMARAIVYRR